MSVEELVAQLRPIRLPVEFATFGFTEMLAAFALGILAGALLRYLILLFLDRREDPVAATRRAFAGMRGMNDDDRLVALARMLDRLDPERGVRRPVDLRNSLYDPAARADFGALEAAVLKAARSARRGS